jgi:hypothetical protein
MARTVPDGWEAINAAEAVPFELATLRRLAVALPDDCVVFHGVHWTRLAHGCSVFGEVDFIILGRSGQVIVVEQKSGPLEETADGLSKNYQGKRKSVSRQMQRSIDALQSRFTQGHPGKRLALDYLLYCPDYQLQSPATAGIAPERIVDARSARALPEKIIAMLAALQPAQGVNYTDVHGFLSDELELVPDTAALIGRARTLVTRLSGGLATWARQLDFAPFRLRIDGTAGSGKTQLALHVLNDAAAKGQRALYVCFNRPLADHVRRLVPPSVGVTTFHMLCDDRARERGEVPDFAQIDVFDRLAEAFVANPPQPEHQVDVLVIDEGQDFEQAWADTLLSHVHAGGKAWWMEDPMQNLYGRPAVALPRWVTLHARANYRTPRDVLRDIGLLIGARGHAEAASPIDGEGIEIVSYADLDGLREATAAAIGSAQRVGFTPADIVVLTFRGREHSALLAFDQLGGYAMRRFDGSYDGGGNPIFRPGDVLIETVFRFKGQSAPCIVLTEIDFEALDEGVVRRLYVGATRATMRLSLIVSDRAARELIDRLS